VDGDARTLADVFIVAAFVGVLKTTPAADIVGEDRLELSLAGFNLGDHPTEALAAFHAEPAFALIGKYPDDLHSPFGRVFLDAIQLILGRVLLMLRGHAHVGGNRYAVAADGRQR